MYIQGFLHPFPYFDIIKSNQKLMADGIFSFRYFFSLHQLFNLI